MHILCSPCASQRSVSHSFSEGWFFAVTVFFYRQERRTPGIFLNFDF